MKKQNKLISSLFFPHASSAKLVNAQCQPLFSATCSQISFENVYAFCESFVLLCAKKLLGTITDLGWASKLMSALNLMKNLLAAVHTVFFFE